MSWERRHGDVCAEECDDTHPFHAQDNPCASARSYPEGEGFLMTHWATLQASATCLPPPPSGLENRRQRSPGNAYPRASANPNQIPSLHMLHAVSRSVVPCSLVLITTLLRTVEAFASGGVDLSRALWVHRPMHCCLTGFAQSR